MEKTPIDPKGLSNKRYIKPFNRGRLEMEKCLIFYYDTPRTSRVRQISLRLVPTKFRQVAISSFHVSLLSGQIHELRTLLMRMEWICGSMVNK